MSDTAPLVRNANERVRSEVGRSGRRLRGAELSKAHIRTDQQTAAGERADFDEMAPIHDRRRGIGRACVHCEPPSAGVRPDASSAARLIPERIRKYVAQRHRLPPIARSISASFGCGLLLSNAAAVMIWPAWQ